MDKYTYSEAEQALLEGMSAPLAVYQFIDRRVVTLALSDGFCELFGYTDRAEAYHDMDYNMYRDTHPDDAARIADAAFRFATEGGKYEVIYRTRKKDGPGYRIIHAQGKHVLTETGARLAHVWYTDEGAYAEEWSGRGKGLLNDALNSALHEESILKASYYDFLTGLPSMTYFFELAEAGRKAILAAGKQPVLLYMDLVGMKFFNQKYGFAEGDRLLRAFSKLLIQTFSHENCSHFGSDHFAVFTDSEHIEDRLRGLFRECRALNDGRTLPIRVGVYPDDMEAVPASTACDRAKFACDAIRHAVSSAFNYYSQNLRDNAERRQYILDNLDRAIAEKWIKVYYQPIVRAVNGRVCDEEALSRWIDPARGFLSPGDFIPTLEDAGVIYKLDLFVLDQVLDKLRIQKDAGLHLVPQSVNLSRSDFDACDIVEEIRRRVDKAGVSRDLITIEITESVIGGDFEFMKTQVARFQALGFPVWMDDFGNGYSSLDVLQSIHFNLIKFDMGFMRKLDEGDQGKIVLTELVKMVTSLGIDTVCEGVETEEQVRFLQEIGCSKLQGYYYTRPIPLDEVLARYREGRQIGFENPEESAYYEAIGRVNLFDLNVIASEEENAFQNFFNTLPIAIMEIRDGKVRFVRSNHSYRDFMRRFFDISLSDLSQEFTDAPFGPGSEFMNLVRQCCADGSRAFYDEKMPDGSIVHSFARRIGINPVTGTRAAAVAVLSITRATEGATYASIARALAADYHNIYFVDLRTDDYIVYTSPIGGEGLAVEGRGVDFFADSRKAENLIYEQDRESFYAAFTKENVIRELDKQGVFTISYRLMDSGKPVYVGMKVVRAYPDMDHIVIGVSIIDSQVKQKELEATLRQERIVFKRFAALSDNYLTIYTVNLETGDYLQYSATCDYESLGLAKEGKNFFEQSAVNLRKAIHPEDQDKCLRLFTRANVLAAIRENGQFTMRYRLVINDMPVPVTLRAALVKESDGEKLIVGVSRTEE